MQIKSLIKYINKIINKKNKITAQSNMQMDFIYSLDESFYTNFGAPSKIWCLPTQAACNCTLLVPCELLA